MDKDLSFFKVDKEDEEEGEDLLNRLKQLNQQFKQGKMLSNEDQVKFWRSCVQPSIECASELNDFPQSFKNSVAASKYQKNSVLAQLLKDYGDQKILEATELLKQGMFQDTSKLLLILAHISPADPGSVSEMTSSPDPRIQRLVTDLLSNVPITYSGATLAKLIFNHPQDTLTLMLEHPSCKVLTTFHTRGLITF